MAELPSGAVTFLFTDIEGSTRLVKQFRDRYDEVLADHQRLLREAFAAHNGYEVDTQGDSFFVAFSSARDALLAAVEGQLALLGHPWPDGTPVKVRMGLHTGQARAADGRYTGLAVHRAARIGAAGHGGQILLSQATQTLLEDEEEDLHVFLRDLGEQRLKDLDRPVRLYQAGADGLPASFPPPRGEAPLAQAAEVALAPPLWRRTPVLAAAGLVLLAAVAAAVFLATRDSGGGLSGVRPNHVGVIDPETNDIVDEIPVGIRPGAIAGGRGAVWVANLDDQTLTKIASTSRMPADTVPLADRTPTGLAVGEGGVWVAHGLRGQLSRVDPQFGTVTKTLDVTSGLVPGVRGAVATGAGAVWAVYDDSTFARIDPADPPHVARSGVAGDGPTALVVARGLIWVVNALEPTVTRYSPDTFDEGPIGLAIRVGRRPTAIAEGEGALWVANADDDTVTRIDLTTSAAPPIRVGDGPVAVTVGAGSVWVANSGDGTVSRIDAATSEVVETIEVGNAPAGIDVSADAVWVSVQAP
jgi:YVTN family beta-propeller protein